MKSLRRKKSKLRPRVWIVTIALVVVLIVIFEPTFVLRGFLRGEPFFQGRPASYWREVIQREFTPKEVPARLNDLTSDRAFAVLKRCSKDPDPTVRAMAVRLAALGAELPDVTADHVRRVRDQLVSVYENDDDKRVRSEAIGGVSSLDRSSTSRDRLWSQVGSGTKGEANLRNMPMNSELRCVGIATVAEALLQAKQLGKDSRPLSVALLSERISNNWTLGKTISIPPMVQIGGQNQPLTSSQSLNRLSTKVTDIYKQTHERLAKSEGGREQLRAAARQFLPTRKKLDEILDDDPDRTAVFCGVGRRFFSSAKVTTTYHAFLIRKMNDGRKFIFDPNDPGSPIPCKVVDASDGVTVEWRCRYRDTGQITRQKYRVVHGRDYFRAVLK